MIKAYIFDFDGTLMDTEVLWVEAAERYLAERNTVITHDEAVRIVYGRSWLDVFESIVAICPDAHSSRMEMEEAMRVHMLALREGRDLSIPESVDLLRRLSGQYPVCIVSGSPRTDLLTSLDELDVHSHLEFVLAAEDYGPGKPDPACFLMAAERLQVAPSECLVFEDSAAGINAAKRAGMRAVALVRPGLPAQGMSAADMIVSSLSDVSADVIDAIAT